VARFNKYIKLFVCLVVLVGVIRTATAGTDNHAGAFTHRDVSWSDLTFMGSNALVKVTVKIQLGSPADMCGDLLTTMGAELADCSEVGRDIQFMTVETTAKGNVFFYEQYTEQFWFNPADGRAYRRIRWFKGSDPWIKTYCWSDKGVRRQNIRPGNSDENKRPPTQWTRRIASFYPYPKDIVGCSIISGPTFVFNILSTLEPGCLHTPFEICVFGKKQLHRLTCRYEKCLPMGVSFKIHSPGGEVNVDTTLKPLVFSIMAESVIHENMEPEIFSMLGIQKDIRIYIDPSRCLPIRISGTNTKIGKLVLELSDVRLN
jgi:hypothetical protein